MKYFNIIALAIIVATSSNCTAKPEIKQEQDTFCLDSAFKKDLKFVQATKQGVTEGIHLTGTIEPDPDKVVVFKSLFSGVVLNTYFSLGDKVSKGQVLAEISSTEFSSLNAELKGVEAQIKVAESKLKATSDMYRDGLASQKELNEAQSELEILHAEKAKVVSNRTLYSASSTKNVFQLKAPATGIVTSKNITAGMQIPDDGDPLFTISNLQQVWAMANIYASNLQGVKEGMEVEMKTISYPDKVFKGKISVISQMLDESSKVLKARIVLDNKDMELKPGMLVDMVVLHKRGIEAVAVPASEVIFSNNENYVVVYKNDCDVQIRNIRVLARNNDNVFVEDGLAEGEKVVSEKQLLIFNQLSN